MPTISIGEIVDFVDGRFSGDRTRLITAVAPLADAKSDQISFLSSSKYLPQLGATQAAAVLVAENLRGDDVRWVRVGDPSFAVSQVLGRWFSTRPMPKGISPQASIAPNARLGENVGIGPFVTIAADVVLGDNVTVFQGVSIEAGSTIGDGSVIYPNVVIYDGTQIGRRCIVHAGAVIGSDGYGFTMHRGKHHKIPQIGIVRIEDDVEIGAGTTIDRATFGETVIGEGTKIDNLVMIGHNVKIGKHCLLVSQVGIAGSTELGNYVAAGGKAGFSGHLKIGNRVQVAGGGAVFGNLPDGAKVMGWPAVPIREFVRKDNALTRLAKKKE